MDTALYRSFTGLGRGPVASARCCDFRRCSCELCVRIRPTPTCRATGCWCAAGYIRRAAPGGFTMLPLGWIVQRNIERVVRAGMELAGSQEVHFPALLPREPYEVSGRWTEYGDNIFRLKDRRGNDFLLAPTHEEMFTLLVKDLYSSYRDLPLSLFQIQAKFRDEARPARRSAARPRVRDEGLVLVRHRRRRSRRVVRRAPRCVHRHVRPARVAVRDRVGDVGSDGWLGERGVPRPAGCG